MNDQIYCGNCGSIVKSASRFCPECGHPLQADAWPPASVSREVIPPTEKMDYPPSSPFPAYDTGAVQAAEPAPQKNMRTIYLIGAGLFIIVCFAIGTVFAVSRLIFSDDSESPIALFSDPTSTPTDPPPTLVPTSPPLQPAQSSSTLTGRQELSDTSFFDDFSSQTLGWFQDSDANSGAGYENGRYFIQVNTPDYRQLVYTPLKAQTHLEFTAEVVSGISNGSFGVACYWKDFDNHHYVFFDLYKNQLFIEKIENGEWINLSESQGFPKLSDSQRYAVDCTPGLFSVYINDDLVYELPVSMPVQDYQMLFGVSAWSDAEPGGIKVLFDDVSGYKAMQ